jgi:starvation-inducible outer membrane lipoprotein
MKKSIALLFAASTLFLAGCCTTPHATKLTAEQAGALARQLANQEAQALYNCQPFRNGPPAELVQGKWVWHDRQTQRAVDIEATVRFALDGTDPDVKLTPEDSRPGRSGF